MTNITSTYIIAIETTWYGPTNHRGNRVKATAGAGRTVWINCGCGRDETGYNYHDEAALKLMKKMGWNWNLIAASKPSGNGNVYICTD